MALPVCAGGSGTFRFGTHRHSNCYDLSPVMLKKRIGYYVSEHYRMRIDAFAKEKGAVTVLEKAKYDAP